MGRFSFITYMVKLSSLVSHLLIFDLCQKLKINRGAPSTICVLFDFIYVKYFLRKCCWYIYFT